MYNRFEMGEFGEKLVADYFRSLRSEVLMSYDSYDDSKDMTIDGVPAEIKTQTLYRSFGEFKQPAFTVDIAVDDTKIYKNQLNKCVNVERLFFVRRSSLEDLRVSIYEAPKLGLRKFSISQNYKDKRYVAGFLLKDMNLVKSFVDAEIVNKFMDNYKKFI